MNPNLQHKPWRRVALALVLGAALAGCAAEAPRIPAEMAQRIEAARTSADHEAIAAHFTQEAASARASADNHRKMARAYTNATRDGASMRTHCNAIARSQDAIATEYDGLVVAHRELARQAKP